MQRKTIYGYLCLTIANLCLGLNSPLSMRLFVSTEASEHVSAFAMSSYRVIGAAVLFWVVSLFTPREKVAPKDLGMILLASVFGVQLNQFLYLWGLSLTTPIDAPIIAAMVPIMTMVLAMLFLREPITLLKSGGVLLGASGAIFLVTMNTSGVGSGVASAGSSPVVGQIICLFAALSYSIYLTLFKGVITKYSVITTMKWMFLFSAVVASVIFREDIMAVDYGAMSLSGWGTISFVATMGTFVAFLCILSAQKVIRPTAVSMFNYLQPIAAVIFSVIMGVAIFDWRKGVAALAIFVGVWMVTQSKSRADVESQRK